MQHECEFPEVLIEETDEDGNLKAGMKVLVPCPVCGETPLEQFEFMQNHLTELNTALLAQEPYRMLYHWAPWKRRGQILRYGLRPGMRTTTSTGLLGGSCICLADSPSWAWTLSGGMPHAPGGQWDLWQTSLDRLTDPLVLATDERPSGLYEVRTEHRIYKRDIWWVGSRFAMKET
jgi:hypothetical protein